MSLYRGSDEQGLASIRKRSTSLAGILRREIDAHHHFSLDEIFAFTLATGGEREVGFEREAGVSYNPRPARLVQILIGDCDVRDPVILSGAILACSDEVEKFGGEESLKNYVETLRRVIARDDEGIEDLGVQQIASCLALDYARHYPQVVKYQRERGEGWNWRKGDLRPEEFLERLGYFQELADRSAPRVGAFIRHWRERQNERFA